MMLTDQIIDASKKISEIINMVSSYLKIYVDYCYSLLGQASLFFCLYLA